MYKPSDHPDVSAYMLASDAEAVIDFAEKVLGGSVLMKHLRPDGIIAHSEVRIGDSVVMIAQATADYPAHPAWLHVYVPDVDETYRKALAHGATSVQAPTKKEDADRRGGVKDMAGNVWWIATLQG